MEKNQSLLNRKLEQEKLLTFNEMSCRNVHMNKFYLSKDQQFRKYMVFTLIKEFTKLQQEIQSFGILDDLVSEIKYFLNYCFHLNDIDRVIEIYYMTSVLLNLMLEHQLWVFLIKYWFHNHIEYILKDFEKESFKKYNDYNENTNIKKFIENTKQKIEYDIDLCRKRLDEDLMN